MQCFLLTSSYLYFIWPSDLFHLLRLYFFQLTFVVVSRQFYPLQLVLQIPYLFVLTLLTKIVFSETYNTTVRVIIWILPLSYKDRLQILWGAIWKWHFSRPKDVNCRRPIGVRGGQWVGPGEKVARHKQGPDGDSVCLGQTGHPILMITVLSPTLGSEWSSTCTPCPFLSMSGHVDTLMWATGNITRYMQGWCNQRKETLEHHTVESCTITYSTVGHWTSGPLVARVTAIKTKTPVFLNPCLIKVVLHRRLTDTTLNCKQSHQFPVESIMKKNNL